MAAMSCICDDEDEKYHDDYYYCNAYDDDDDHDDDNDDADDYHYDTHRERNAQQRQNLHTQTHQDCEKNLQTLWRC